MADERQRDVPEGRVNAIKPRSTQDVLKDLKTEAEKLEAKKYKPPADAVQDKGRKPVATITTNEIAEKNKDAADADKGYNRKPDTESPYHGVDPRKAEHAKHPPKTTADALKDIGKREEEGEAQTKVRADAAKKHAEADAKKVEQAERDIHLGKITVNQDGTFDPPDDPPKTSDELKKTKRPAADWPEDKFVTLEGKNYTFSRGTWRLAKKQP